MLVAAVMVSVCVEVLLARFESVWSALTVAIFVAVPGAPARVSIVTVAVAPLFIDPSKQVTVPPAWEQVPCVVESCSQVTSLGRGSVTVTLVAVAGPLFVTAKL